MYITLKEVQDTIKVLKFIQFESVYYQSHFYEANVDFHNSEKSLDALKIQISNFQSGLDKSNNFNQFLDRITQGINEVIEQDIQPNHRLKTFLNISQISFNQFTSFVGKFMSNISILQKADEQLSDVEKYYSKENKLAADTSNTVNSSQLDNILKLEAAYAYVIRNYARFARILCYFVSTCDRPTGYFFKNELVESLKTLFKNNDNFEEDTPFSSKSLNLLNPEMFVPNSERIYNNTEEIRQDIINQTVNIA